MTHSLRLTIASVALLASAACSRSSEQPALSDDLKQDLARAGAADVQLAGSTTQREPPGGWKTPGEVIRNAPFPINP